LHGTVDTYHSGDVNCNAGDVDRLQLLEMSIASMLTTSIGMLATPIAILAVFIAVLHGDVHCNVSAGEVDRMPAFIAVYMISDVHGCHVLATSSLL
jgi:hypothetical protein